MLTPLQHLAYFAIGVTFFSAAVLLGGHLWSRGYADRPRARIFGSALLLNLSLIQLLHYLALADQLDIWSSPAYVGNLFCTGPLFFFFCRAVLRRDQGEPTWAWAAALPPVVGAAFPGPVMFFVSFVIGSTYFAALALQLAGLRSQRRRFAAEMVSLSSLFVIAGMTLVLGLLIPWIDQSVFVAVFAVLNGASFLPAMLLLVRYPDVLSRAEEALEMARAHSTLEGTDIPQKLRELTRLMSQDQLYRDESLNLAGLAEQLELSPHQTSELLNQHLGLGFSRFLRQHRVRDACRLLAEDRDASVLSIALAVGFSSQSTFYTAFREETGQSPGQYRRDPGGGATAN